uniref:RNA-dependent RNA polymerase n=1 Tax=Thedrake partiti-like virus TaxID=2716664 RepID=A0A6G7PSB6_9VIRU|nr:RNA-dependent RNA polymerase [Thedrake partiti-like virus]
MTMLQRRPFRAEYLVQWNARKSNDETEPLIDKVVVAVLHQQGIPFEYSGDYRNIYSYDKLMEQLEHYDRKFTLNKDNPYLKFGLSVAFKLFACPDTKMRLETVELVSGATELIETLNIKEDRSAGLTAYGESKATAFTVGLDKAIDILQNGKSPAPCLAGVRTQRGEKTRLVWGYPLEMTIIESVVARPLINYFREADTVMSFGMYSHETGARMRTSASQTKYHYSLDYSQFDAHIGPQFIQYAFDAFRTWFNLDDKVCGDVTLRELFDQIQKYFATTPIVMPKRGAKYPEVVVGKRGGVPSGSYFTQLVDSFVNTALIFACSARFQLGLRDENVFVLGDDCLFFCNKDGSPELLSKMSQFLCTLGFKVNAEKGSCGLSTDEIEYLGRRWKNGFPVRSMKEVTRGSLYPENYRKYSPERGIRQKQVLSVLNSYLLTSYLEDPPVGVDVFQQVYEITPWMSSGFTEFLLREGLIPGDSLRRAIY